jgi:hypothetical protein
MYLALIATKRLNEEERGVVRIEASLTQDWCRSPPQYPEAEAERQEQDDEGNEDVHLFEKSNHARYLKFIIVSCFPLETSLALHLSL